nr:MAG TPA: hypothetical protein [Caudoviricetes sp.]DAR78271.1 MAG TPA: hypothetical protein [Caudoviricetes sp.]DAT73006.1 MAG TPA: hypothetical protein [Caudoviricetes sp.]DAY14296.1 MAG TPA: hypothetical protein [Caudoviricetes sp.]
MFFSFNLAFSFAVFIIYTSFFYLLSILKLIRL